MNEKLSRTAFDQLETTEKQALMESLAARYDMVFLGLHTFDRWGQSCTTGLFKKVAARVAEIEYDPNRTARIALLNYADGEKRYILAPVGIQQGDVIEAGDKADIKPGNALTLNRIPVGTNVHNIEMHPGRGGQMCRAAGTYAQLVGKDGKYVILRLPSGEVRKVLGTCIATVGQVGNVQHENISLGKAGRNRWLSRRPKVRGVAMNPVDHPLGGGEGRSSGGRHPVTPWGIPTKGYKTRAKKKPSGRLIIKSRGQK